MKKVPDVGVPRKRGRPPKKQAAIETSTPVTGEGTQLSVTGTVALDVAANQAPADTASSERQNSNSGLKSRKGGKSASLGCAKMTGRKRHQDSSDGTNSDDKRFTSSSRRSSKDKVKTLLYKAVKQKAHKLSQQGKSSTSHILGRGKPKKVIPISQNKKSKLRKICSSKIKRIKSTKTEANELNDSITPEMRRLLTTDGFWSTKASSRSNSPQSQSVDTNLQRQTAATKKDSRTSTPDITPSGTGRHSLSKTRPDKDDTTPQRSNIPAPELRRLRTTEGFSFAENAVTSKTNSRDVSPCSSSSLDRGTRLNSRSVVRSNENKNSMKVDDADQVAVADDAVSARSKITKKETCNNKEKLSEDQRDIVSTVNPPTAEVDKFVHCDSPVSRFRKKHFLDKVANIAKQKRLSGSSQSKKILTLMQETSKKQKIKRRAVTAQSVGGESSVHPKFSTSTNTPEVNKGKRFSRLAVDKGITEKTPERRRKGKQKQQNILDVSTLGPTALLEGGLEISPAPSASNISLSNSISSTKSSAPEFLITDLFESAELKRLNTTAGFWSAASGIEKIHNIYQPRKLRDADGNSINEANDSVKLKAVKRRNLHLTKFSKTAVTSSTLLQHRKKKLRSLQSKLIKTEQSAPSNDLTEQQQPPVVNIPPAPTEGGFGRKSRPRACLFGMRRRRRKRDITLDKDSQDGTIQEIQTVSESFDVAHSEASPKESAESAVSLIDASRSKCEKEKCVLKKGADLNSSEIDTKKSVDYLIAKYDCDTTESGQVVKTSKELLDVEMYSLTSPETADVSLDTSVSDTPTAQKTLMKTGKRGRGKLSSGEVRVTPSSSIKTRGRGKVDSTMDNSLEILPNLEPSNEEALLTSSSATSKVVSERRKMKKTKKASVAELDLSKHMSGSEVDRKSSHSAELTEVNLKPSNKDGLLASSPTTSKVVSEKRKKKKAKQESHAKLDLPEHMSGCEIDRRSSHPAEITEINLKPNNKDALLTSSPATSKVVSERQKMKKAKKASLIELHMSGSEIDKKSPHPAELTEVSLKPSNKDGLLTSSPAISKVVSERRKMKKASLADLDLSQNVSGSKIDKKSSHPAETSEVNLEPSNKDTVLTSSPAISKAVSEKRKVKKTKKASLAELDFCHHMSGSEIDKKSPHPAEITEVNLGSSKKDDLLASLPATSKVPSESQKVTEVKNESLAELDLCERVSCCEIDKKSSHPAEIAEIKKPQIKDNEKDNSSDPQISTSEVGSIDKHVHIGKQNSALTKCNLFESLGFSLSMPSEASPVSFVNSSACDVRDPFCLNENVAESHFMTHDLPATENVCDMKLNDVFCVLQTESSAINVSASTESISPQQLKGAELKVTDAGTGFVSGTFEDVGDGCLDVYHDDSVVYTSGGVQDLQSAPSNDSVISFEPVIQDIQGYVQTDALNTTSVSESQNYAPSVNVLVLEAKTDAVKDGNLTCESSGVVESSSTSEENTSAENIAASAAILECVTSEKQYRDDESMAIIKKVIISTLEAPSIEHHVENIQPTESCVETDSPIPLASKTTVSTSADIGFEKLQNDLTEQSLIAEAKGEKSNNVSKESTDVDNREQCEVLKSGSINATDDTAEDIAMSVKSVVGGDTKLDSVTLNSGAKSGSAHLSCEHSNFQPQKRKSKETIEFSRFKIRKHMAKTAVTSTSLDTKSLSFSADRLAIYDFNSSEEVAESTQNELKTQEANSTLQAPVKKARKRKRNAWQRGVLHKAARLSQKPKKSVKSVSPEQSDMSSSVLVSDDNKVYVADDVEKIVLDDDKVCVADDVEKIVLDDDKVCVALDVEKIVSDDDKVCVADDVEKIVSDDDKVSVADDVEKIVSYDDKVCVADDIEKTVSDDDKVCVANDLEKIVSYDDKVCVADDIEKTVSDDDKVCVANDLEKMVSVDDKACVPDDVEKIVSHDDKVCVADDTEKIVSDDDKDCVANDVEKIVSGDDKVCVANDIEKIVSHDDDKDCIADDVEKIISDDDKACLANDVEKLVSDDDKVCVPDDVEKIISDDDKVCVADDIEKIVSDDKVCDANDAEKILSNDDKVYVVDDIEKILSHDDKVCVADDVDKKVSDDDKVCVADDVEKISALASALISDIVDGNQMSDCLHENILLPALNSSCEDENQGSPRVQMCREVSSAALISDISTKISGLNDGNIQNSDGCNIQVSVDNVFKMSDDSNIKISDDRNIQISDESKIKSSDERHIKILDDSNINISDDSNIKISGDSSITISDDNSFTISDNSNIKISDNSVVHVSNYSKIQVSSDSKIPVCEDNNIQFSDDSKIPVPPNSKIQISDDNWKHAVSIPLSTSDDKTTPPKSEHLLGENGHLITEDYPPAVTKSLKNMLKKLQTNANLAHADFGVQSYKGKFLRKVQQKEQQQKRLRIRRQLLHADQIKGNSEGLVPSSIDPQVGVSDLPVKKKRGRPRKQTGEALPKLTPVGMLPILRSVVPWNKPPPDLSPQDLTLPPFLDVCDEKSTQDADIVSESVDDTDLHLYLSGVSDDEQSPRKDPSLVSFHADISVYQEKKDSGSSVYEEIKDSSIAVYPQEKGSSISVSPEKKDRSIMQEMVTNKPFGSEEPFITLNSLVASGKEPKKRGRPKKGSRGRPPGIPMTDEERLKRKHEEKLKRRKALKVFKEECEDQNLLNFLRTSQRSVDTPDVFAAPSFSGSASSPSGNFSLRKKSTRSPLEMIAIKRKQEEAIYDMEQERRQARLIHLREKRCARESGEGFSDDDVGEDSSDNLMTCSVVLNDFVKKLQLDELDLSSGEEVSHEAPENMRPRRESPDYNPFEDRNEDWRADFEERESEEWNNNRPSIPRLKLKRVIKKGTQSQAKIPKRTAQSPKEPQYQPIKLVIKTEPVAELNEQTGLRLGSGIESSKVERSGFENSYMDFLKQKSQFVSGKGDVAKRSYNVPRSAQLQASTQNGITDLNAVEILSLPTSGVRGALAVGTNSLIAGVQPASAGRLISGSTSVGDRASALALTKEGLSAYPLDTLSSLEHAGTSKPVLSVDDDEDILILDLEDGAVEQNSGGLPRFPGSASSAVRHTHGIVNPTRNHESISESYGSRIDNASLIHLQSFSNDEMGLMFESYNSQKDSDKLSQLGVAQNAAAIFVSTGNFEELSGSKETSVHSDIPQPLACGFIDTGIKVSVSVPQPQKSQYEVQTPHTVDISMDTLTGSAEPSNQSTKEIGDSVSVAVSDDVTNTEAFLNTGHTDGNISAAIHCKKQGDEDSISIVNQATDSVILNTVINDIPTIGGVFDSEVSAVAASNKAVVYVPGDVSSDSNNVTSACTSSLKTGSFKKPGLVGDNKSPKHSTYHGCVPEDWRVKVILHSDKFVSGKYSCKRCSFTAPSKLAIESHIYSHIPGVQFRCAYCESEFSSMAATSSHLKNTHSLSEAKLHISRHIDEKNFYDKETAVFSEESGQQSPIHPTSAGTNAGGQSPPVIISVVVSSRGGRSSAHRFVCTHCGFSTNVKEDAEHHVLDLHSTQALFACLLCSENVCYTENEIKDHCAVVHPARKHPYKKLPDFYDAELLSLKEKAASQDDRENIFERMSSLFQDETQPSISNIDHKQKAKEYLYLQEGWKEKTKVEADSTTAGDYTDETDNTEEPLARLVTVEIESPAESIHRSTVGENEVFADHRSSSQVPDDSGIEAVCETAALINDDFITSSAGSATHVSIDSQVDSNAGSERHDQQTFQAEAFSQLEELPNHAARETTEDEGIQHVNLDHGIEDNDDDDDGGGMGLKIVQVVSLSEQSEDLDEQMAAEQEHMGTDSSAGSSEIPQDGTVVSENSLSGNKVPEFSPEHSSTPVDIVAPAETPLPSSTEKEIPTAGTTVATESSATESPAADTSSVSSPIASPSFAGGLPLSYKCNACRVHTPYLLMMVKHLKAKHPNMRCFSCPYCKTAQSFVSQKQLRHHVKQSHPTKFGRNEIALSEDAKKFVEAMVLPIGPECIRVGNRIVLEEDIHTCTYCQVKMVSLTSVYEHLNTKHSDLFEFVCPVCQNFRSKLLPEIFDHCLHTHKSSLDTDKVHVSVPKNLFSALTCISKSGKYIEKTLALGSPDKIPAGPSASTLQQPEKAQVASSPRRMPQLSTESLLSSEQHPLSETLSATTPLIPVVETMPTAQAIHPIFAVPLTSTSIGAAPCATRPVIPFSSSLFDTSSLISPQSAVATHSIPFIQNAAASSFLSPLPQQAHSNHQHMQSGKQLHSKSNERTHGSAKHLPVLNVPTIRPRTSPVAAKPVAGSPVEAMPLPAPNCNLSVMSTPGAGQQSFRSPGSSSIIDSLPDSEPNPDAFKIFNLCPTGPRTSPAPTPSLPPGVPTVFPPVSAPMAAGYIQGTIAGFPPGMVISPNLLFPYSQHPSMMQGLLAQKQNPQTSSMARHPHLSHSSSALMAAQSASARRNSMASEAAATTAYLKKQQQRELYLKKQQHQQLESHRHQLFRLSQQQTVQRAYPAHQQPPSLSGQVYQPQPLPVQSLPYDHHQPLAGPSDPLHASIFASSVAPSSAGASSSQLMAHSSPSPVRPAKGLHKRSNTLYQCPYCPVMVTLKALEVASHIQQHHPGKQVTFRKIV